MQEIHCRMGVAFPTISSKKIVLEDTGGRGDLLHITYTQISAAIPF